MIRPLILSALVLLLAACGGATTDTPSQPADSATITGQIVNWQTSYGTYLTARIFNEASAATPAPVDAAGNFSLELPAPTNFLNFAEARECEFTIRNTLQLNNPAAKFSFMYLSIDGSDINSVTLQNGPDSTYTLAASLIYVDTPFTATGQIECSDEFRDGVETYNFNFARGWNYYVYEPIRNASGEWEGTNYYSAPFSPTLEGYDYCAYISESF
jgi:hypothetical protein